MRLVSYTEVRDELGMDNVTEYNNAIMAALDAATVSLAATLRTGFDRVSGTDDFHVTNPNQQYMALRAGFVDPTVTITSVYARTRAELWSAPQTTSVVLADPEKGVILFTGAPGDASYFWGEIPRADLRYMRIGYTAGWAPDGTDATLYDQTKVPAWLKVAAKMYAKIVLSNHPAFADSKSTTDSKMLNDSVSLTLAGHVRYLPWATQNLP